MGRERSIQVSGFISYFCQLLDFWLTKLFLPTTQVFLDFLDSYISYIYLRQLAVVLAGCGSSS